MGSKGPKISSFMIRESSGTSNKIVGAILLQSWIRINDNDDNNNNNNNHNIATSYSLVLSRSPP